MNFSFLNAVGVTWLCAMAFCGTMCVIAALIDYLQEWLRARKTLNTAVPALTASVEELCRRQSRLEMDLAQIRRLREGVATRGEEHHIYEDHVAEKIHALAGGL